MDKLTDKQLEDVFQLCDAKNKGFITVADLQAWNSEPDTLAAIQIKLRMGMNDKLTLKDFIRRIRDADETSPPGVNFTNIYNRHFCTKVFCTAFICLQFGYEIFWVKGNWCKIQKLLVKCW